MTTLLALYSYDQIAPILIRYNISAIWRYFSLENISKDNKFILIEGFSKFVTDLLISRNILQFYSTIINIFPYEKVRYSNILSISIELSVLYEGNYTLIITKDKFSLQIIIVRLEQLIKEFLQLYSFLYYIDLGYIFGFVRRGNYYRLTFRRLTNYSTSYIKNEFAGRLLNYIISLI